LNKYKTQTIKKAISTIYIIKYITGIPYIIIVWAVKVPAELEVVVFMLFLFVLNIFTFFVCSVVPNNLSYSASFSCLLSTLNFEYIMYQKSYATCTGFVLKTALFYLLRVIEYMYSITHA